MPAGILRLKRHEDCGPVLDCHARVSTPGGGRVLITQAIRGPQMSLEDDQEVQKLLFTYIIYFLEVRVNEKESSSFWEDSESSSMPVRSAICVCGPETVLVVEVDPRRCPAYCQIAR